MSSSRPHEHHRERSAERDHKHSSSRHSSERSSERDSSSSKHKKRSRSRSRSRDRDHKKHDKHEKQEKHSKHARRSRSRSRSESPSDRDRSSKKDKKEERKKEKESARDLERALKKAQKLLKHGGAAGGADGLAALDSGLLDKLIAEQKAAAEAAAASEKSSKRSKHGDKRKRKDSSSDDSDASSSDSSDDESAAVSLVLADGVTPRLFKKDYFARSTEFRVWLHETYKKHVDDMPSKAAHAKFKDFISAWNSNKLAAKFYKGMDTSSLPPSALTKHKWGFASKMTESEKMKLASLRDDIDTSTYHHSYQQEFQGLATTHKESQEALAKVSASALAQKAMQERAAAASSSAARPAASASAPESSADRADRLRREKADQKRLNSHHSMVLEELVPRPTGREAVLEKRTIKGAYAHQDPRDQADAALNEKDLMGESTGAEEYSNMKAKRINQQHKKEEEHAAKLSEHQLREKEKMKKMLTSLGLQDKYPIN